MGKKKLPHAYRPLGIPLFFLYPEALPERLGIVTYLTDFGTLLDGQFSSSKVPIKCS
jgi:hypothetical protein